MRVWMIWLFLVILSGCSDKTTNQPLDIQIPAFTLHLASPDTVQTQCGPVLGHAKGCLIETWASSDSEPRHIIGRDVYLPLDGERNSAHELLHVAGKDHAWMEKFQPWVIGGFY